VVGIRCWRVLPRPFARPVVKQSHRVLCLHFSPPPFGPALSANSFPCFLGCKACFFCALFLALFSFFCVFVSPPSTVSWDLFRWFCRQVIFFFFKTTIPLLRFFPDTPFSLPSASLTWVTKYSRHDDYTRGDPPDFLFPPLSPFPGRKKLLEVDVLWRWKFFFHVPSDPDLFLVRILPVRVIFFCCNVLLVGGSFFFSRAFFLDMFEVMLGLRAALFSEEFFALLFSLCSFFSFPTSSRVSGA